MPIINSICQLKPVFLSVHKLNTKKICNLTDVNKFHYVHKFKNKLSRKYFLIKNCCNLQKNKQISKIEMTLHPTPYFEPLMRSFILGISIGGLSELLNYIASPVLNNSTVNYVGTHPNLLLDHFSALCSWLLFYLMEAKAIDIILKNSQENDPVYIAKKIDRYMTFPKRLLPCRMIIIKKILLRCTGVYPEQNISNIVPFEIKKTRTNFNNDNETNRKLENIDSGLPLKREKELYLRKKFLKNFWYAAALSSELKSKPLGVEILGKHIVLFRDSDGVPHALSNICPHRGAPLDDGWTTQIDSHKCIVCPYHGWAFNKSGVLCDVPAATNNTELPKKQLLNKYIITEKGGFIWYFNGSLSAIERPPIPCIPELDDKKWKAAYGSINFNCPHWSVFENAIDMAHIHYLHAGTFGNQNQPEIKNMRCKTNTFNVTGNFTLHNKPVNALWEFAKIPQVDVTAIAFLPSTSVISFTLGSGLSFITFVNTVPIDKNRSCNRFALIRRLDIQKLPVISKIFSSNLLDDIAVKAMLKILTEDKTMVESLTPQYLDNEISVKADMIQLAFRKLRNDFLKFEYGQDLFI